MHIRKMLNTLAAAVLCLGSLSPAVFAEASQAAGPAIHFSDLISGPNRGGQHDKGAVVTIVGKNFGTSRGDGYVSVGGGTAAEYPVWSDTKISFQVGQEAASGEIKVTTPSGTSNGVPFTVRPGRIFFVSARAAGAGSGSFDDPWKDPKSFMEVMTAGDTCYFRDGVYDGTYGASGSAFGFVENSPNGAPNAEIAFVGWPGETAQVRGAAGFMFDSGRSHYVIAGFSMYGEKKCVGIDGTHIRLANNLMEGLKTHAYGIIHPLKGDEVQIYGNEIFGATSRDKKDHPVYVGYGSDNVDIGWNHFHSNDVAEGPVISVNTDYAVTEHHKFENIRIHDNTIDCRKSSAPLRAIGVVATDRGSTVYVYNNTIIGGGGHTIYLYSASAYIYNNVFYESAGSASIYLQTVVDGANHYKPETVEIKNNVFYNKPGCEYLKVEDEPGIGSIVLESNSYHGNGKGPSRDRRAVNADPQFVRPAAGDFRLQSNSVCIDSGSDTVSVVKRDKDGVRRPQNGVADIGAFEFFTGVGGGEEAGSGDGEIVVVGSTAGRGTVNPARGESAQIHFRGSGGGDFECRIFTATGEQVWERAQYFNGEGVIEWTPPAGLASGMYLVHIKGPGINMFKKIAILS